MSPTKKLPQVGYTFNFEHEFIARFKYLNEKYGWENGDQLEVIRHMENIDGEEVLLVLNVEPNVLTTANITDLTLFETPKTEEELAVDELVAMILEEPYDPEYKHCDLDEAHERSLRVAANVIVRADYRPFNPNSVVFSNVQLSILALALKGGALNAAERREMNDILHVVEGRIKQVGRN